MEVELAELEVVLGRRPVLQGIDLRLQDGVTGLLGPNGAGKSTLLRVLATLLRPRRGRVRVGPWSLPEEQDALRRHLGYLPQEPGLPGALTGREYLELAAAVKGVPPAEVDRQLEEVGLTAVADWRLHTYSGGMRQRLAIAQALLGDPDLLLVDEPTAGLDPEQRTRFRELLAKRRPGRSVLFSTHQLSDLEAIADRVAVLHRGRLRFTGSLAELARLAEGRVWRWTAPRAEVEAVRRRPGIRLLGERWAGEELEVRLLAMAAPCPEAEPVSPTAEDGYLALVGEEER